MLTGVHIVSHVAGGTSSHVASAFTNMFWPQALRSCASECAAKSHEHSEPATTNLTICAACIAVSWVESTL
jgi:hypothetical protein